MGDKRGSHRFLVGDQREGERLILEWNFKKWDGDARNGLFWHRMGTDGALCKHGNEHSGSIKCGEFLEELRTC